MELKASDIHSFLFRKHHPSTILPWLALFCMSLIVLPFSIPLHTFYACSLILFSFCSLILVASRNAYLNSQKPFQPEHPWFYNLLHTITAPGDCYYLGLSHLEAIPRCPGTKELYKLFTTKRSIFTLFAAHKKNFNVGLSIIPWLILAGVSFIMLPLAPTFNLFFAACCFSIVSIGALLLVTSFNIYANRDRYNQGFLIFPNSDKTEDSSTKISSFFHNFLRRVTAPGDRYYLGFPLLEYALDTPTALIPAVGAAQLSIKVKKVVVEELKKQGPSEANIYDIETGYCTFQSPNS